MTVGPAEGSFTREESFELGFTGTDDVIAAEDLLFECSENGGEFVACESPYEYMPETQGPQSLAVRAIDDVGLVDSTPAMRRWTSIPHRPGSLRSEGHDASSGPVSSTGFLPSTTLIGEIRCASGVH